MFDRCLKGLLFSSIILYGASAQNTERKGDEPAVRWSGELRIRSEADGRDLRTRTPMNMYTLSRVRLGADVGLSRSVNVIVQVQDARTFGEEKDATGAYSQTANTKNLDLHQAYVVVESFLFDGLTITLGRMERAYGNERVLSPSGWNNVGRSFDGLVARYMHSSGFIDGIAFNTAENNTIASSLTPARASYSRDTGQVIAGLYSSTRLMEDAVSADLYALYQWDGRQTRRDTSDLRRVTFGSLVKGRSGALSGDCEVSLQYGSRYDVATSRADVSIRSYSLAASVAYSFPVTWIRSVSASVDILSGRRPSFKSATSYEPVFPSSHRYFGFADYFTSFPAQVYDRGMVDVYLRADANPVNDLAIQLTLHTYSLQYNYTIGSVSSTDLGAECDVVAKWKYSRHLTFESGVSVLAPGDVLRSTYGGGDLGTHLYLTTQVNF